MRINSINSHNAYRENIQQTNKNTNNSITSFKSKLPGLKFKYTKGYEDYWNEFGQQCIDKGYGNRLRQALEKLKSNQDDNLLALTYHSTFEKRGDIDYTATSAYSFSLHPNSESKNIDVDKRLNFKNVTVFVTEEHEQEKYGRQRIFTTRKLKTFPENIEHSKDDSFIKIILRALESIVEKGTKANDMIFREKINFIDEYRV